MGLVLLVLLLFLIFGGVGIHLGGTLGTILIILAVVWLLGGFGYHGSRCGWWGPGPGC